jgi:hypothetical protein
MRPYLKKTLHKKKKKRKKKRAGGVVQCVGLEFKPQYRREEKHSYFRF